MADEKLLMLTRSRIASLSGLSERQLSYWERTGLLRATVERQLVGNRQTRLYDFQDAMTAMVLSALREKVSLQHIRQIVDHLRRLEYAVTQVRFAIEDRRVYFQVPDGSWGDTADPDQILLHQVLDLKPLRARVLNAADRAKSQRGRIEKRRGVHGSAPVIAGTRISVKAVRAHLDAGRTQDEILASYPALTPDDLEAVRNLATA